MSGMKPCRFCNGSARVIVNQKGVVDNEYVAECYAECRKCKARTRNFKTIMEAIDCWNSAKEGGVDGTRD